MFKKIHSSTPFISQKRTNASRSLNRRKALELVLGLSLVPVLSACGGGSGGETQPENDPGSSDTERIFGQSTGLFRATPSKSSVEVLTSFSISTDATTKAYDYLALVYYFSDTEYYVDYPIETSPGNLEAISPIGRVSSTGVVSHGEVKVFVVRILGESEEISDVFTLSLVPPTTPAFTVDDYLLAVSAALGVVRDNALRTSYSLEPAETPVEYVPTSLVALNGSLYDPTVGGALASMIDAPTELAMLRLYLCALLKATGVDLTDYSRPVAASTPISDRMQTAALSARRTMEINSPIDFEAFGRAVADKVRADSAVIKRVGSLIGAVGAVGLALGAGPIAGAAIGVGATMVAVGMTVGLTEGFLWDNLNNLAGANAERVLNFRQTALYWFDNVTGWVLPQMTSNLLPSATNNIISSRAGAYLYEVSRNEVLSRVKSAVVNAVTVASSLNFSQAFGNSLVTGVSNAWLGWRAEGFSQSSFPLAQYSSSWRAEFNPQPTIPPGTPPFPGCFLPNGVRYNC